MPNRPDTEFSIAMIAFVGGLLGSRLLQLRHTRFGTLAPVQGNPAWYFHGIMAISITAAAIVFGKIGWFSAILFGVWALVEIGRMASAFWKQRPQFLLKHLLLATLAVAALCSASRYVPWAALLIFLTLPASQWIRQHPYRRFPFKEPINQPLDSVVLDSKLRWRDVAKHLPSLFLMVGLLVLQTVIAIHCAQAPNFAPGMPPLAGTAPPIPNPPPDPPPSGAGSPDARKSVLVAMPPLKRVEAFRRKVVFFAKDVDSPFLRLPEPGEVAESFFDQVMPYVSSRHKMMCGDVVMLNDGDLAFSTGDAIYRATKDGRAEKLLGMSDVTMTCRDPLPDKLRFEQLLASSATKPIVYVGVSNSSSFEDGPGSYSSDKYRSFLGKLDLTSRRCLLASESPHGCAVDPDADVLYKASEVSVARMNFEGNLERRWPVRCCPGWCSLARDGKSLLLHGSNLPRAVFDLATGNEIGMPIQSDVAVLGTGNTVFFVRKAEYKNGTREAWLYCHQTGQAAPRQLFFVSCKRWKPNFLINSQPVLSADGTWLAWPLPLEGVESGTLLLDLTNLEYRILRGRWTGVQWNDF